MNTPQCNSVACWMLAGGQGRRMGGLDKGMQPYKGLPLAQWGLDRIRPQSGWQGISANRNQEKYKALLGGAQVWPDDPDLPSDSGPLAGIITGLRHAPLDWLMVIPCDTPALPNDLVTTLLETAVGQGLDAATPMTAMPDGTRCPHWVCSLIHKRVYPKLLDEFVKGERKVGRFIQSLHWTAVSFSQHSAFANLNTLESLNGHV
ncbi:MAG TPA: molybdenum cofactor guanylyltransferase MobA [Aquabacterium sp.]|nr:molybdenum cofactor guanylyltransferase MobA [Aquabacterium sp.]